MQNEVEDDETGGLLVDTQTANYLEAELALRTDTISELNVGNGITFADNVYFDQDLSVKDLRILNSTRDGYVSLISNIDPGTTISFGLPSTLPSNNDVFVYNGTSGQIEWSDTINLDSITVNDLILPGITEGLLLNTGTTIIALNLGASGILSIDPTSGLGITWADPGSLLNRTKYIDVYNGITSVSIPQSGTPIDIILDTQRVYDSDVFNHNISVNPQEIVFLETGNYLVFARATFTGGVGIAGAARTEIQVYLQLDSGGGFSQIPGSLFHSYSRGEDFDESTTCTQLVVTVTAGDKLKMTALITSGQDRTTSLQQSGIVITKVESITGPQGPPGAPGDFIWRGEWQSQNYVINDVVQYLGSSYICILNTTLSQPPTDVIYWELVASAGDPTELNVRYFDGYDNTGLLTVPVGSYVDIPLDIQREIATDTYSHTLTSSDVTIIKDGTYVVHGRVSTRNPSGSGTRCQSTCRLSLNTGSGFNPVDGSDAWMYNREENEGTTTGCFKVILGLNNGDILKMQTSTTSGIAVETVPDSSGLIIYNIEGIVGPTGPQGPAGTQGDFVWQGSWQVQDYVVNDVVEYQGSSYVCILNTTAQQPPSNPTYWELVAQKGDDGVSNAINIGTSGIGIFDGITGGSTFQFKKLNIGSNKIILTDDVANDEIDIDIDPTNIDHIQLQNIGTNTHAQIDTHIASTSNPHAVTLNQITPTTTAGDLLVENGSTVIRLPVGTTGQILFGDPSQVESVRWADLDAYYPYGSFFNFGVSNGLSQTTSATYQTKVSFTTPTVPPGTYKISTSYNWNYSIDTRSFFGRVTVNGTEIITHVSRRSGPPGGANGVIELQSGFTIATAAISNSYTIVLEYRAQQAGDTAYILNARVEFYRVT